MNAKQKKIITRVIIISISVMFFACLLFGAWALGRQWGRLEYQTQGRKIPVLVQTSPSHFFELVIYQIGDPEFPFGCTHCRYELYSARKLVNGLNFSVANDGRVVHENNFNVEWEPNAVVIRVSGEEQQDIYYRLYSDGRTESWSEEEEAPGNPIAEQAETGEISK